jgi:hypothetical protein
MHDSCSFHIALPLTRSGKLVDRLDLPSLLISFSDSFFKYIKPGFHLFNHRFGQDYTQISWSRDKISPYMLSLTQALDVKHQLDASHRNVILGEARVNSINAAFRHAPPPKEYCLAHPQRRIAFHANSRISTRRPAIRYNLIYFPSPVTQRKQTRLPRSECESDEQRRPIWALTRTHSHAQLHLGATIKTRDL